MKILFIHRSVGQHLMRYGNLRALLNTRGMEIDDYNNNSGTLTHSDGSTDKNSINLPGGDTKPVNFEAYFKGWDSLLNSYDLVMIKSCYPNSNIKTDEQLEQIKSQYQNIIEAFINHNKPLLILTTPPLRPIMTSNAAAKRADVLATWLVSQSNNLIHVFDFRKLLADKNGMLKVGYRHWSMPWDNHPKAKAHKIIAPQLVNYIISIE